MAITGALKSTKVRAMVTGGLIECKESLRSDWNRTYISLRTAVRSDNRRTSLLDDYVKPGLLLWTIRLRDARQKVLFLQPGRIEQA